MLLKTQTRKPQVWLRSKSKKARRIRAEPVGQALSGQVPGHHEGGSHRADDPAVAGGRRGVQRLGQARGRPDDLFDHHRADVRRSLERVPGEESIASLTQLAAPRTKVVRDGAVTEIETEAVVPGDILLVGSGSRIAADARLVTAYSLQVDESSLTGESLPVAKDSGDEISAERSIARRRQGRSRRDRLVIEPARSPRSPKRSSRRRPRSSWP